MRSLDVTPASPSPTARIVFDGSPAVVAKIFFRNALLSLLTLGFYRFWGRVRMRRYLWQHLEVAGYRLSFTGTGGELFRGFCKLVGLVVAFVVARIPLDKALPEPWSGLVAAIVVVVAAPAITFSARRYRLRRTTMGHVAFGAGGRLKDFWLMSLRGIALSILSLGWTWPDYAERRQEFLLRHTTWGDHAFRYEGDPAAVRQIVIRALPWLVLTAGVYTIWLSATLARFRAPRTRLGEACLAVDYTGVEVLRLAAVSTLVTLLSFGLALPWVICWRLQFLADHVAIQGRLPLVTGSGVQTSAAGAAFADGDIGLEL